MPPRESRHASRVLLLVIAYIGFVSLGLPDAVIGMAWPSMRQTFGRAQGDAGLLFLCSGCGYFLSSALSGRVVQHLGIGLVLTASTALVAAACCGYGLSPVWPGLWACAALGGLGSGAIDAGLNGYAARHFSARHMNWLHACYSLGAMLGPLLLTFILARSLPWRWGYLTIGAFMASLSLLFLATVKKWDGGSATEAAQTTPHASASETLRDPLVWLHLVLFLLYTGLEIMIGVWSFALLTEARGVNKETAGLWVTTYYGSLWVGRVLLGIVVERVGVNRLLRSGMLGALAGSLLLACGGASSLTPFGLALIGFSLAPIFPGLMSQTPRRLGPSRTIHVIGWQVSAAMIGGAGLPALAGWLAQTSGLEIVVVLAVAGLLVVLVTHEIVLRIARTRPEA